jgi:hypothetical protein
MHRIDERPEVGDRTGGQRCARTGLQQVPHAQHPDDGDGGRRRRPTTIGTQQPLGHRQQDDRPSGPYRRGCP